MTPEETPEPLPLLDQAPHLWCVQIACGCCGIRRAARLDDLPAILAALPPEQRALALEPYRLDAELAGCKLVNDGLRLELTAARAEVERLKAELASAVRHVSGVEYSANFDALVKKEREKR